MSYCSQQIRTRTSGFGGKLKGVEMNEWTLQYVEPKSSRETILLRGARIRRPSAANRCGSETRLRSALRALRIA
jgi:hypothetical protein